MLKLILLLLASQTIYLKGHIKSKAAGLTILVKEGRRIIAKTTTDKKGDFNVVFTMPERKTVDFYCTQKGMDTLLMASVKTFESETPELTFTVPAKP